MSRFHHYKYDFLHIHHLHNHPFQQMNKIYLLGSSFFYDRQSKEYAIKILSKIKYYTSEPTLLIMDNLDMIYGTLYDLFNQRFISTSEYRYCNIVYEDFKENLSINEHFRCIIFKNQTDLETSEEKIENKLPSDRKSVV